jgi:Arc/MetJ family transcription regulator
MKIAIELSDALVRAANRVATSRGATFQTVVELALRRYLESSARPSLQLRRRRFRGRGLQGGASEGDWVAIGERAYEGRGG